MSQFFTRREAAHAIALLLHPNDHALQTEVAEHYDSQIYSALCDGELVAHWPDTRLPITHPNLRLPAQSRMLAGAIALSGGVIIEADLNAWLARLGVGVEIRGTRPGERRSAMPPGPERDAAMKATHAYYKENGGKELIRTAADFDCSKTVVTRAIAKANKARSIVETRRGSRDWDPFGRNG